MSQLTNLLDKPVTKYIAAGGLSFVIEMLLIYCLIMVGVGRITSVAIAFWVGLGVSFTLQKLYAFQNRDTAKKKVASQFILYGLLVAFNYCFTVAVVYMLSPLLGVFVSRALALAITTTWNFVIYKKIIFKSHAGDNTNRMTLANVARRIGVCILLLIPIAFYCIPMFRSGIAFSSGDFDMQIQMIEAAKLTILEYGEFPLWNPWISGGVPLFADPQFSLFSPQMILSLVLPSVVAWKVTFFLYLAVGFFSMFKLTTFLSKSDNTLQKLVNILLSYIWVFNGFFLVRFNGGHFNFILLSVLPLAIYLILTFDKSKKRFIQTSALFAYLLYATMHYPTIFIFLIVSSITLILLCIDLLQLIKNQGSLFYKKILETKSFKQFTFLVSTLSAAFVLALPRIIPTLQYLASNAVERQGAAEGFIGIASGIKALFLPYGSYELTGAAFNSFEATSYIGQLTFVVLLLNAAAVLIHVRKKGGASWDLLRSFFCFSVLGITFFVLGLGGKLYSLLQSLPLLSMMRVSTRYFIVTAICILLVLSLSVAITGKGRLAKLTALILLLSTLQLFRWGFVWSTKFWSSTSLDRTTLTKNLEKHSQPPDSEKYWKVVSKSAQYSKTHATREHKSQLITDNALVPTVAIGTNRCDVDEVNCQFVLTKNATVRHWSPNEIILERTAPGEIALNMNAGRKWTVSSGVLEYQSLTVDPHASITIRDSSEQFIKLSYSW